MITNLEPLCVIRQVWTGFSLCHYAFQIVLANQPEQHLTITVGGIGLRSILVSPSSMVDAMNGYPGETILLALGTATLLSMGARNMRRIPPLLFLCTLVVTVVIFSSDGIGGNHLIDLQVASAVLVVDWAFQAGVPDFAIGASAAACLIVWLGLMVNYGSTDTEHQVFRALVIFRSEGSSEAYIPVVNRRLHSEPGQRTD